MFTATMVLATAALGIDTGWQPLEEGGMEYIIQIDPQLLGSLTEEDVLTSEVPEVSDVRRYRIVVGKAKLPRIDPPRPPSTETPLPKPDEPSVNSKTAPPSQEKLKLPDRYSLETPDLPTLPPVDRDALPPVEWAKTIPDNSEGAPRKFDPESAVQEIPGRVASFKEPVAGDTASAKAEKPSAAASNAPSESKPWLPLIGASLLLVLSIAANAYLAWIWLDTRRRYHALVDERRAVT